MSLEKFLEEAIVNRKSFVFYDSFYQAMSYLNDKEKICLLYTSPSPRD